MTDTNLNRDLSPEDGVTNGGNTPAPDAPNEQQRPGSETEAPSPSAGRPSQSMGTTAQLQPENGRSGGREDSGGDSSQSMGTTAQLQPENGRSGGREDSGGDFSQSIALVSDPEGLQRQWDSVQVGFVDDPRNAVREADALVLATIEELAAGFNDQRSRLEAAWARGGDASTDDLRGAFRTYRDFFERLLSV